MSNCMITRTNSSAIKYIDVALKSDNDGNIYYHPTQHINGCNLLIGLYSCTDNKYARYCSNTDEYPQIKITLESWDNKKLSKNDVVIRFIYI